MKSGLSTKLKIKAIGKHLCLALSLACLLVIGACSKKEEKLTLEVVEQVQQTAWLQNYLNDRTLAYIRIPSVWSFANAKNNIYREAQGSAEHAAQVRLLQQDISKWLAAEDSGDDKSLEWLKFFTSSVNGPLEVIIKKAEQGISSEFAAAVPFVSKKAMQDFFRIASQKRLLLIPQDMKIDSEGQFRFEQITFSFYWHETASQLILLQQTENSTLSAKTWFETLQKNPQNTVVQDLQKVDVDGNGLVFWINAQQSAYFANLFPDPSTLQAVQMSNVMIGATQIIGGYGVRDGRGRLKLYVKAGQSGIRTYAYSANNELTLKTAGEPDLALVLNLPDGAKFKAIENSIIGLQKQQASTDYVDLSNEFKELAGFAIADLFAAIGPEYIAVRDKAGLYLAIKIQNQEKWQQILAAFKDKPRWKYQEKSYAGLQIKHLLIPQMPMMEEDWLKDIPAIAQDILFKPGSHIYWVEQDGYLIMADIPQLLKDRQNYLSEQTLNSWLVDQQKNNFQHSWLGFSGKIKSIPSSMYYYYLMGLQMLADVSESSFDIYQFPTANELGLPQYAVLGVQLDSSDEGFGVELTYDATPADVLLSGNYGAIAAIGILAAVALPAYQDYTHRAFVMEQMLIASSQKTLVSEHFATQGRMPNQVEVAAMAIEGDEASSKGFYNSTIEADTGVITIVLKHENPQFNLRALVLQPEMTEAGYLQWRCTSPDLEAKYLPLSCR